MPAENKMIVSFLKGINQAVDEQLISFDEAIKMENVDIDDGALKAPKQNVLIGANPNGIRSIAQYYQAHQSNIVTFSNGSMYKLLNSTNTFSLLESGFQSDDFDYINYQVGVNEKIILCNGVDDTYLYDGIDLEPLKKKGGSSTLSDTNKAPKGKYVELHKERVWITGNPDDTNRVYFSNDFDPHDWTTPLSEGEANQHGGEIDIPTFDGGKIVGMKTLFDDIIIFKSHNVWRIFGSDPTNYSMSMVFDSINGTIIDKTIASQHNRVFWTSNEGIFQFDGTNVVIISDKIRKTVDRFNKEHLHKARAIFHNNKYILAVPVDDSTENNLVIEYNTLTDAYSIKEYDVVAFTQRDNKLYMAKSTGELYEYEAGERSVINARWENGLNVIDSLNSEKRVFAFYCVASGQGQLNITCKTERGVKSKILEVNSDLPKPFKLKLKNKGRLIGLKIETIGRSNFSIKQPQIFYEIDYD